MSEELVKHQDDGLSSRTREDVEAIVRDQKTIQDQLVADLEAALNMIQGYQRALSMLQSPDPYFVEARNMLTKYKMAYEKPAEGFQIFADGVDITEHPDSIEGTVIERAELIADENGNLRLVPVSGDFVEDADTFADEEDPTEPIDPSTRDWLSESIEIVVRGFPDTSRWDDDGGSVDVDD